MVNDENIDWIFKDYFSQLFTSSHPSEDDMSQIVKGIMTSLNWEHQHMLDSSISDEEIQNAVF